MPNYQANFKGVTLDAAIVKYLELESDGGAASKGWVNSQLNNYLTQSNAATTYLSSTRNVISLCGSTGTTTGITDGSQISMTTGSPVPKSGIYLVFFKIAMCGANKSGLKAGAYWSFQLKTSGGTNVYPYRGLRGAYPICVPIGASWDSEVWVAMLYNLTQGTAYTATATNQTGISTDETYGSSIGIDALFISEV